MSIKLCNEDINPYIIISSKLTKNACPPAGTSFGLRTVKWFELELILWGEGKINTQGIDIPTTKGLVFFRKPGMVVEGFSPYSCYLIVFDIVFNKDRLSRYKDSNWYNTPESEHYWTANGFSFTENSCANLPSCMNGSSFELLEDLFEKSYLDFIRNPKNTNVIFQKSIILSILDILNRQTRIMTSNSTRAITTHLENIKRVMAIIDNNPSRSYTLRFLAAEANLSTNFFCSTFKKIAGISPFNYINTVRTRMAARMLIETKIPIKEISYKCGFVNETYFFTIFKRFQGQTPQAYRNSFYWANRMN